MKHLKITLLALLLAAPGAFAQKKPAVKKAAQAPATAITIPLFNDGYTKLLKHIEAGNTDVNYEEFRANYLYSEQFKVASEKSQEYNRLKTLLAEQLAGQKFADVIATAKKMLSINYTSLYAQTAIASGYLEQGDKKNAVKYAAIQKGLLESILSRGSGTSCANGWPVIQEEEEYFILESRGAGVVSSDIDRKSGICDQFVTNTGGKTKKYYFETSLLEEGKKLLTPPEEVNTGN